MLDAEQQLFSVKRDLAEARYAYLLARLKLKYYAGVLNDGDLQQMAGYFES